MKLDNLYLGVINVLALELISCSGIHERKLADKLGVTQSHLNKLKNGKIKNPKLQTILKILHYAQQQDITLDRKREETL